mgnify:FL=1
MNWSDLWDVVSDGIDAIDGAFDWLNGNEAAADFISGAAVAGIQYVSAEKQREADMELVELRERREDDRRRVNYASIDGYTGGLTANSGLLTNGLLANQGG